MVFHIGQPINMALLSPASLQPPQIKGIAFGLLVALDSALLAWLPPSLPRAPPPFAISLLENHTLSEILDQSPRVCVWTSCPLVQLSQGSPPITSVGLRSATRLQLDLTPLNVNKCLPPPPHNALFLFFKT